VEQGRGKRRGFVDSGRRLGGRERAGGKVGDLVAHAVGIVEGATRARGAGRRRSDGGINKYKINRRERHRTGNDAIDGTLAEKLFEWIFYASEARERPVGGNMRGTAAFGCG
jgi:hypothetical protein